MDEEQVDPKFAEFLQQDEVDPDAASVLPPADAAPERSMSDEVNQRWERQWQRATLPIILVVLGVGWIIIKGCDAGRNF